MRGACNIYSTREAQPAAALSDGLLLLFIFPRLGSSEPKTAETQTMTEPKAFIQRGVDLTFHNCFIFFSPVLPIPLLIDGRNDQHYNIAIAVNHHANSSRKVLTQLRLNLICLRIEIQRRITNSELLSGHMYRAIGCLGPITVVGLPVSEMRAILKAHPKAL